MGKELIYVGDPMCSWCWGFSPILGDIRKQCEGRAEVSLITGGLHTDWTEPQDKDRIEFLRHHWVEINERSGQPFAYDILERDDFVYNTEPACRAAVTVREMDGDTRALDFFTSLQRAFYADNADVTQTDVLTELAAKAGVDAAMFAEIFNSDTLKANTQGDFNTARELGVSGFPTIVARDGDQYAYLTLGYRPYADLQPVLEQWLNAK